MNDAKLNYARADTFHFFSSLHVHSKKVGIGALDLHEILLSSVQLSADNERFAE